MKIIKTRILVETGELEAGKFPQISVEEWCEDCGKFVQMTNLIHTAQINGQDEKTLDVWTNAEKARNASPDNDDSILCLVSLVLN